MRTFLKRILFFTMLLTLVVVISAVVYDYYKDIYLENENMRLKAGVTTLIVGDSHAETTFDDSIIPNSRNTAFHAEHYLFTYFKLIKLVESNPQVDRVILSLGAHNLSQGQQH